MSELVPRALFTVWLLSIVATSLLPQGSRLFNASICVTILGLLVALYGVTR